MRDVIVLGAVNQDYALRLPRRPGPGETLVTSHVERFDGGKGANQAVAAARLGVSTALVACVGDDPAGAHQMQALQREGVDTSYVLVDNGVPTGLAFITLTDDGENSIVVGLGANAKLSVAHVSRAWAELGPAQVAVAQTEVGPAPVDAFAVAARATGARLIVNAAPVHRLAANTLAAADPLVVNEHEAAQLLERFADHTSGGAYTVAARLLDQVGVRSAIVTLAAAGAVVADSAGTWRIRPPSVEATDTTGAGDAFIGALAAELSQGRALVSAALTATAAGARAVTRPGARSGFGGPADLVEAKAAVLVTRVEAY